ncbi:MAG: Snf7 family protein [Candidatus Bathyarchaeota archaeon]
MTKLTKNWEKESQESIIKKIGEKIHHKKESLRERIEYVLWKLKTQHEKLEQALTRMQNHDKELFEKCVKAELSRDHARATIYANECAEVRKMARIMILSQLALEKVMLRLETVKEFGETLKEIAPVSGVIHNIKGRLSGIIPEVSYELGAISEMLDGMVTEVGEASGVTIPFKAENEESKRILEEASAVVEQKMKEKFPETPPIYKEPSTSSLHLT